MVFNLVNAVLDEFVILTIFVKHEKVDFGSIFSKNRLFLHFFLHETLAHDVCMQHKAAQRSGSVRERAHCEFS